MMAWFLNESDGSQTRLPVCSADWQPSAFWVTACLHDPVGEICRQHREFFRNRKVAHAQRR